jgi:hypothetical protein
MMPCPVCGAENSHLAVVCTKCGSFLQQRVENLDLFACAWSILERPTRGFRTVALARHKNYVVLLSAAAGFGFAFGFFWLAKMGEYASNLVNILGAGLVLGPPAGILTVLFASIVIVLSARVMHLPVRLRDAYAVSAYAVVPVILTVILFLPVELMSFGPYFFARSPSPYLLRPFSYIALLALDGAFALWSVILLVIGVRVLLRATWVRSALAVGITLLLAGLGVAALLHIAVPRI